MFEQFELFVGKLDGLAVANDLVAAEIHFNVSEGVAVLLLGKSLRAAQHGFDASEQFANRKWLGDIVIGAEFQPDHLVDFLASSREDDARNGGRVGFEMA